MNLIRGITAIIAIILATLLVYIPLTWWLLCLLWTRGSARRDLKRRMDQIIIWWTAMNRTTFTSLGLTEVTLQWHQLDEMSAQQWYLVVCNHQSWTDIVLLQSYLYGKIPPLKFFTKAQLIWIPLIGLAMKVLGFPYVQRVTKAQIRANPKLRHADRDNVRAACEGFGSHPTSILNFVEGTRLTSQKHARQDSEFKHLLRPKTGGLAYVLDEMGTQFHRLLDVTIIYPDGTPTFWDFLQGKCRHVHINVTPHAIPAEVLQAEESQRRVALGQWMKQLWLSKDQHIEQLLHGKH